MVYFLVDYVADDDFNDFQRISGELQFLRCYTVR